MLGQLRSTQKKNVTSISCRKQKPIPDRLLTKVKGFVSKQELTRLEKGIVLNGVKTKRCRAKMFKYNKKSDVGYVKITITEGRNHQVKDMLNAIGHDVIKLKRESEAFLNLEGLKVGEYRYLSTKEVKKLYSLGKTTK